MALEDTYLRLDLDYTYSQFAALTTEQQKSIALQIGNQPVSFRPFIDARNHQRQITGAYGRDSRMIPDNRSLTVGRNGFNMPISHLSRMSIAQVEMLSEMVKKGAITATVKNKGLTPGSDPSDWRDGYEITAEEIRDYFIQPRSLWEGITSTGSAPTTEDEFVFLPGHFDSQIILEQNAIGNVDNTTTITVYTYNPVDGSVSEVAEFTNVGDERIRLGEDLRHPYLLPVVTAIAGTDPEVNISLGFVYTRAG